LGKRPGQKKKARGPGASTLGLWRGGGAGGGGGEKTRGVGGIGGQNKKQGGARGGKPPFGAALRPEKGTTAFPVTRPGARIGGQERLPRRNFRKGVGPGNRPRGKKGPVGAKKALEKVFSEGGGAGNVENKARAGGGDTRGGWGNLA